MENKDFAIAYLADHRKDLLEKRERLMRPLQELDQEIEHVTATLRSIQKTQALGDLPKEDFPIGKLRKLTQVQALVVIAKHNDGIVRAQEAKRLLIKAGVMRETKNSTNIIHAVILRSEKFERVRPGEYRLKEKNVTPASSQLEAVTRLGNLPSKTM
jgi:hypothetical protein